MSIFNRRNAAVGWLTMAAAKRVIKKKARGAVPTVDLETKRPNKSAVVLAVGLVGAAGALTVWRAVSH